MIKSVTFYKGKVFKETVFKPFCNDINQLWVVSFVRDHVSTFNSNKQHVHSIHFSDSEKAYNFYNQLTQFCEQEDLLTINLD
jgi:hypothetical protein